MKEYDQIERRLTRLLGGTPVSHKWDKVKKHRIERRRAKRNPECIPRYRKYKGWEW